MARCDLCGTTILFGGITENELRFCNETCHQNGVLLAAANEIPEDMMSDRLAEVHQGECPQCGGPGPVDVHTSHIVWSAILVTSWKSNVQVSCRKCGVKSKIKGMLVSGLFGWWGFPWGIIATPIQVFRNVSGLFWSPDPTTPSAELEKLVRVDLAEQLVLAERMQHTEAQPAGNAAADDAVV